MRFAFSGPSVDSAYFRGIGRALDARGHEVAFPVAIAGGEGFDVVVEAGGLDRAAADVPGRPLRILWDVDAPAPLGRMERAPDDSLRDLLPAYDLVLTDGGGGDRLVRRYEALGARECIPVHHALDPDVHHPVPPRQDLRADLALLADRLPDREARVEELFLRTVEALPDRTFLLGGSGWDDRVRGLPNLRYLAHVPPRDRNAVHCSALAVLSVTREDVFAAAGAGACLISDAWPGIEHFLRPCKEVKLVRHGDDVAEWVRDLDADEARRCGDAARERMLAEHTYGHRAEQLESILSVHAA